MPKRYDLIVFDWDGTLVDSTQLIVDSILAASLDVGLTPPEPSAARGIIGLGLPEALRTLFGVLSGEQQQQITARYRYHYFAQDHAIPLFAGAFEAIPSLTEKGFKLAVATGKGRRGLNISLERCGLQKYFLTTRCVDECSSKPHPQMLMEIMDELGVEAHRTVMVGDTAYDLQMAQSAGVDSIAVSYGAQPLENLLPYKPVVHFDNFTDLHRWLIMNG
ncbi:MAG TPA: HAD-IA family hydrolase [Methylophilaceae bacterium]|nr:HAD-IA family hydrolase [Methylophilaceae bacterium]